MFPEGRLFEFIIVGVVALIVVGPKDLPILMRKVGQFVARMRAMAAEFRASFDELARQSELDELRKEVEALRSAHPLKAAADAAGVGGTFDDIEAELADANIQLSPAMAYRSPEAPPPEAEASEAPASPPKRRRARRAQPGAQPGALAKAPAAEAPAGTEPRRRRAKAGETLP